ncbi:hypothetical protein FPV67DRAFT_1677961 [Lyophyllum atratum]|nr:hypothetical protein FPV67DRAFT_1677961 [Lyophyllum atratum]
MSTPASFLTPRKADIGGLETFSSYHVDMLTVGWLSRKNSTTQITYEAGQRTPSGGLAEFLRRGDVHVRKDLITTYFPREGRDSTEHESRVLHRLVVNTIGRPLWDYSSEMELLKAVRAATFAHRFLWDQGILHRDINAVNILLAKDFNAAPDGAEGILADFQFARLPSEIRQSEEVSPLTNIEATTRTRTTFHDHQGAVISGTLLFMARELLYGIKTKSQVKQTLEHDMESIIIVLAYTALRKLLTMTSDDDECKEIMKSFKGVFAHHSIDGIINSRSSVFDWIELPFAQRLSTPLRALFDSLDDRLSQRMKANRRMRLMPEPGYPAKPLALNSSESLPLDHACLVGKLDFTLGTLAEM